MTAHPAEVQCARCGSWHPVEDTCTCHFAAGAEEANYMAGIYAWVHSELLETRDELVREGYVAAASIVNNRAATLTLFSGGRSSGEGRTATGTNGGDQ